MRIRSEPKTEGDEEASAGAVLGEEVFAELQEFDIDPTIRRITREEIASLCGLMLNRLGASGQPGAALARSAWAEALKDFGDSLDEPGPSSAPDDEAV